MNSQNKTAGAVTPTPRRRRRRKRLLHVSRKTRRWLRYGCLSVLLALVCGTGTYAFALYRATQVWDKKTMFVEEKEVVDTTKYITVNGEQYYRNEDIVSILLVGIDQEKKDGFNGQCDAIAVLALDTVASTMKIISIPRDTMGKVMRKDVNGDFLDDEIAQLALAYAYGEDDKDSLELTRRCISNFLYGVPITDALSFKIEGVEQANDLVGGVTVTMLEDLSGQPDANGRRHPDMKKGESVHLDGQKAHLYIRHRDTSVQTSSMDRLKRQIQYIKAYFGQAKQKIKENPLFPVFIFQELSPYLMTTLSVQEVAYLSAKALSLELSDDTIVGIEGELKMGEKFVEFYPEEEQVLNLVLDVFYHEKEQKSDTVTSGAFE